MLGRRRTSVRLSAKRRAESPSESVEIVIEISSLVSNASASDNESEIENGNEKAEINENENSSSQNSENNSKSERHNQVSVNNRGSDYESRDRNKGNIDSPVKIPKVPAKVSVDQSLENFVEDPDQDSIEALSAYEVERLRRLEENKKQLLALGIYREPSAPVELPKPRIRVPTKLKIERNEPRRQSGRLAGKIEEFKGLKYLDKNFDNDDRNIDLRGSDNEGGTDSEREFDDNGKPIIVKPMKNAPRISNNVRTGSNIKKAKYERGGRIYDSVNGTSCHQCRQKTLDPKVKCTNIITYRNHDGTEVRAPCPLMMDNLCLEGRYGQNVDEERAKGDWICPKCRGICNCSFCMAKRVAFRSYDYLFWIPGKQPTGQLKNTALQLGYKSVSDMLAKTGKLVAKTKERAKNQENDSHSSKNKV
ncbi:hypothetical protein HK100_004522 [Physocladia obscura]|uniref:Zinc-finger domain-containing protein n=1 Tax=Physocladia obscura TaxID=109957 RepID=A0AAD5X8P9_9FUNG|nr:hypothetical protein HK100_004522 [Physocladia obscura]